MDDTTAAFVEFLLPHLTTAGRYTSEIQKRVQAQPAKGGENPFQQALTDADLSVQAFLEVVLLSRFPQFAFFSEEYEQSLNRKYFDRAGEFEVLLDPVDGTRAYLDRSDKYQIIVTLRRHRAVRAVLCYMPRRSTCYVGMADQPASIYTTKEMETAAKPSRRIQLSAASRRILLFNAPDLKRQLEERFKVVDIMEEYRASKVHHGFPEIFEGEAAACIHPNPQLIDAGAIAFIVQQAGGIVTDFQGRPVDSSVPAEQRLVGGIASATEEFHAEILQAIR